MVNVQNLKIELNAKLEELVAVIQASGKLACALVYDENKFVNILTDGDIRRSIIKAKSFDLTVMDVINVKKNQIRNSPIFVRENTNLDVIKNTFREENLRQLVIVNNLGEPVDVINYEDINYLPHHLEKKFSVLIMAGGFGTRLMPLTENVPKPMLLVNGIPMLEIIIKRLAKINVKSIYISVHYLREKITNYFGDGKSFGVNITYLNEENPMGTGGCLRLIDGMRDDLLIINGDVLSQLDYEMFYGFHVKSKSIVTVAASQYNFIVPYGVIEQQNLQVISLEEKPSFSFLVNSGIYFISPDVFKNLPTNGKFNMTDVIDKQVQIGGRVSCFPIFEKWLDIGQPSDYLLANNFL